MTCARKSSPVSRAPCNGRPVRLSNRRTPTEYRSERASIGPSRTPACSGERYRAASIEALDLVPDAARDRTRTSAAGSVGAGSTSHPRSSGPTMTFDGLTAPCVDPSAWSVSRARSTSRYDHQGALERGGRSSHRGIEGVARDVGPEDPDHAAVDLDLGRQDQPRPHGALGIRGWERSDLARGELLEHDGGSGRDLRGEPAERDAVFSEDAAGAHPFGDRRILRGAAGHQLLRGVVMSVVGSIGDLALALGHDRP